MRSIRGHQGFILSGKSQAQQIELLQSTGWKEDQGAKDIRRWREPRTKALYSLRDAVSLVASRQKMAVVTRFQV